MVAKRELKFIKSLHQKKYRNLNGLFLAEGVKVVTAFTSAGWVPKHLYSSEIMDSFPEAEPLSERELKSVSTLVQPNKILGVFEIPREAAPDYKGWVLALDQVRDPGNLGTIIRLCDWFGIRDIICSPDSVDAFNPKVVMASMGSLARVNLHYLPLQKVLTECGLPVFGADMHGTSAAAFSFPDQGILLMGSESHGISSELREILTQTLSIKPYADTGAESLNLGTAAGILLYEIRRGMAAIQK
ncbi:RNA methyltransferase [Robiginitalea aurantiaca]|uniref:RNA methyltransferase n=1 Tax=Robiginitalea aurantiaca TaxID=3056915 RepID=A0ABT7WIK8_9FLAO|nr:RNA methyltransferase [Robiginitalea aurantiaca]MDM9632764.1 RNA methyltransferase [Robiginitalea aurantiaca]